MFTRRFGYCVLVCVTAVLVLGSAHAQQQGETVPAQQGSAAVVAEPEAPRVALPAESAASVLRLMKFSGLLRDRMGNPRTGVGSTKSEGLPLELFSTGEARWLGIQGHLPGEEEQRVLLVSVPYALKAAGAETLGGKPASAFALAGTVEAGSAKASEKLAADLLREGLTTAPGRAYVISGTINQVAKVHWAEPGRFGQLRHQQTSAARWASEPLLRTPCCT